MERVTLPPSKTGGSESGRFVVILGASLMEMDSVFVSVPAAFLAVMPMVMLPGAVGVPFSWPCTESQLSQAGLPVNVKPGLGVPVAVTGWLKGLPTMADPVRELVIVGALAM